MSKQTRDIFLPDRKPSRGAGMFGGSIVLLVAFAVGASWFVYTQFRVDVPTGHIAILFKKTGLDVSNNDEVAPTEEHKGVQRKFLAEGRYFLNPYEWDWDVVALQDVGQDEVGVRVSLSGDDLPIGEYMAHVDGDGNPTTKGIVPGALNPGRYAIHPYLFRLERHKATEIPAGYVGVVTQLHGKMPENPNTVLVEPGFRGVHKEVLRESRYPINPYEQRVDLVDTRSQRFNLAEQKDMGFPTKDGFWVSLDGRIEFRVDPKRAPEVFVLYNEETTGGHRIDEEIVRKVILPNARSYCRLQGSGKLGREFISGETRAEFENSFEESMREACGPQGIEIIQALITSIEPPQKIAEPIRRREIAFQTEKQYQQQILQQSSEQKLAIEQELVKQKQALVKADQSIVKTVTDAKQKQEVAVTKAKERLGVAQFKLDAAKDEAAAIVARGKAEAQVVGFANEAEAAGWKKAVEAFQGNGGQFAQFVLYQKLAGAYRRVMINTADSPLMQVFESIAPSGTDRKGPPVVPAAVVGPGARAVPDRSETPSASAGSRE